MSSGGRPIWVGTTSVVAFVVVVVVVTFVFLVFAVGRRRPNLIASLVVGFVRACACACACRPPTCAAHIRHRRRRRRRHAGREAAEERRKEAPPGDKGRGDACSRSQGEAKAKLATMEMEIKLSKQSKTANPRSEPPTQSQFSYEQNIQGQINIQRFKESHSNVKGFARTPMH